MSEEMSYRCMNSGEEVEICSLVMDSFNEFIAPDYSQEGIEEFSRYAQPDELSRRSQSNNFVLVSIADEKIIGMIEIWNHNHISMLFVSRKFHRKGVGAELMRRSLEMCRQKDKDLKGVSVYSSPYAVPIYEKLGFRRTEAEQVKNGIRFIPMGLLIESRK